MMQNLRGNIRKLKGLRILKRLKPFYPRDISRAIDDEEYKRSEIAVIYDDKVYGPDRFTYDNRALPMRILNSLESSGIPASWISRDVRTKETYDITTDRVSVISIHSSKGLDFDLVYLVGIDHIKPSKTVKKSMDTLVYVAMTRAKYRAGNTLYRRNRNNKTVKGLSLLERVNSVQGTIQKAPVKTGMR